LLATLSGGMVGVGDPLGAVDKANLLQAVRTDGVIVKPDAPIVPIDAVYLGDARGMIHPMVASTYSDHGAMKALYVFAYGRGQATIAFAAGERAVTLHGYAPSRPAVTATKGAAGAVTYDAASGQFSVAVSPAPDGTAAIRIASAHVHVAER